MSGIVGVYHLDGRPVCRGELGQMNLIQAHRGPDETGIWNEGPIGLGHCMLWTTSESLHEHLPHVSRSGDIVLTADARIDNREELLTLLDLTDHPAKEVSDNALIVAAYEKWGERCPERLLGDFAFALWDRRQHVLFCARDHFGVKSLYYCYRPGRLFACASEIKALLCLPEVPQQLNEVHIADYLGGIFEDKAGTFYQDILRVPPGHSVTVSAQGVQLHCYWSLDRTTELRLGSDGEYAEAYREIFTEAVRCRLRSAFPVGSMLSGGLDSSSIACVARDLRIQDHNHCLHTFSLIFDGVPESDERPFIRTVVDQGGVEPHYIHGDRHTPLTDISRILRYEDGPFYGPNLFLNWEVWGAAHTRGVRVLLDGIMGDNVVSHGYAYLNELARAWRWGKLSRELKALTQRYERRHWKLLGRYVWNDGVKSKAPKWLRQVYQSLCKRQVLGENLSPIIDTEFATQTRLKMRIQRREETQQRRLHSAKEDHYQELISGIIPAALEVADKGTAAFAIEARYPFLDRRLVEFCLAIPPEQKIHDGWTRAIVRLALADHLPAKIRFRSGKGDLGHNFIRGLAAEQEQLERLLFNGPKLLMRYLNLDALRALYQRFIDKEVISDDEILGLHLAALLSLWLRQLELPSLVQGAAGSKF